MQNSFSLTSRELYRVIFGLKVLLICICVYLLQTIREGVRLDSFLRHFKGNFKGKRYDSAFPQISFFEKSPCCHQLRWFDPVILFGYRPTLKLSSIPTFTLILTNSDFLLPRFNTVSFGKHSLRYLGPILWNKLDKDDKTCKSLRDFRNRMRNKDLTSLIDDGCKGCLLCDSWCLIGNNFSILALSFSILANNL